MDNEPKCQNGRQEVTKKSSIASIPAAMQNGARTTTPPEKCHRHASPETLPKFTASDINQDVPEMHLRKNPKSDLLQKVCCIEESKFFFSSQFTKNYVSTGN